MVSSRNRTRRKANLCRHVGFSLVSLFLASHETAASRIALRKHTRTSNAHTQNMQVMPTVRSFNSYRSTINSGFPGRTSFLHRGAEQQESLLQESAALRTQIMHATQYYGDITVGGQKFGVIFDSGSGHLLIPGPKCESPACKQKGRHVYNSKQSGKGMAIGWTDDPVTPVDEDSEDRDVTSISFAAGEVVGNYYRDEVCLGTGFCGMADFIAMQEESDNPFRDSTWDGVLGLGQDLTDNPEFAVLQALFRTNANGNANDNGKAAPYTTSSVFSYFLHDFGGEMNFGPQAVESRIRPGAQVFTVPVSVDGYWQFAVDDITIGGKKTGLCKAYKGGKCQAVVDTGSSLLMAPANLLGEISEKLNIDDKCHKKHIDSIGFLVQDHNLELVPEEFLDRDEKKDECLIAMMPIGDTGRGPIFVLGYPFLRNFMTTFDFDHKQLKFVAKADVLADKTETADSGGLHLTGARPS
ncbi:unnamed protein product [Amoebophrya sp. A25]|nr:unnamed protein product [Amoebophrya sp. A25]|eukprot:GSA25T00024092001.1